jgi:DNA-binding CsgD family transcriptional regulator
MPNEGGGSLVPTAEPFMDDINDILRCLVSNLQKTTGRAGDDDQSIPGEQVLLDVEIDDVRLVAVRRGLPSPISLLSPREREIARMVALGYPNKTIASVLDISSWTVASHLRRVFMKLQVSSRAAMITRLFDTGLISLQSSLSELNYESAESTGGNAAAADPSAQARYYPSFRHNPECVLSVRSPRSMKRIIQSKLSSGSALHWKPWEASSIANP